MSIDNLNRAGRRAAAKYTRQEATKRPAQLTPVEFFRWPQTVGTPPMKVWESRKFLVQMFAAPDHNGCECRRLSICRVTVSADGHWDQNISFDELYDIKSELGFSDWYGMEIHPRTKDMVNVANMRHLWLLREPLQIGWFKS